MKGPELLSYYQDNWETEMGAWFPGERVVLRGKDLLNDLADYDWLQLLFFSISGKLYEGKMLEFMHTCYIIGSSFPDPRLWNNRVAALCGTSRSTPTLGFSAATAVSEATLYGRRPDLRIADFLVRLRKQLDKGAELGQVIEGELKKYRSIPGFGRPVTKVDERVKPMLDKAKALGFDGGFYLGLVYEIEEYLVKSRKRMYKNITSVASALMLDAGLTPKEYYLFCIIAFTAGMFPCMLDAFSKPEGALFPLATDRVRYIGVDKRRW